MIKELYPPKRTVLLPYLSTIYPAIIEFKINYRDKIVERSLPVFYYSGVGFSPSKILLE